MRSGSSDGPVYTGRQAHDASNRQFASSKIDLTTGEV